MSRCAVPGYPDPIAMLGQINKFTSDKIDHFLIAFNKNANKAVIALFDADTMSQHCCYSINPSFVLGTGFSIFKQRLPPLLLKSN